jgi:hypothetical protein
MVVHRHASPSGFGYSLAMRSKHQHLLRRVTVRVLRRDRMGFSL